MPTNPGTTNLVSWWALDETSGTRADSHGANDLTDNNTVLYAAGKQSNAATFVGANIETLTITDAAQSGLSFGDEAFSIGCWARATGASGQGAIINKWTHVSGPGYLLWYLNGSAKFNCLGGASGSVTGGLMANNTWVFLVAYHDPVANTIGISTNGGAYTTAAFSGGPNTNATAFVLGGFNGLGASWDGDTDEAFVFNKVLTADEVAWLYNSGAGVSYSDVAGGSALPIIRQAYHMARA